MFVKKQFAEQFWTESFVEGVLSRREKEIKQFKKKMMLENDCWNALKSVTAKKMQEMECIVNEE